MTNDYYRDGQDAHPEEHRAVTPRSSSTWEFESLPAHQEEDFETRFINAWNQGKVRKVGTDVYVVPANKNLK